MPLMYLLSVDNFALVMDNTSGNVTPGLMGSTSNESIESSEYENCDTFRFVFCTLFIGSINILGLLGNILSILVLQKDENNRVATFLLQSLAVADSLVLLLSFIVYSIFYGLLPYANRNDLAVVMIPYLVKYVQPIGYMSQCLTIWITVLLAVNRFIAIVKPFLAPTLCTLTKARLQVLGVTIAAILFNLPRFFQYKVAHVYLPPAYNTTGVAFNETTIGENTLFGVIYTNIIYTILVLIAPLLILIALNSCLVRELKFPRSRRSNMSVISNSSKKSSKSSLHRRHSSTGPPLPEEDNITFIMVIIIVVFICCHTPDRIYHIVRYFFATHEQLRCGKTLFYVSSVCNLLIVINSSTNFIIYYMLRRRFRKILMMKICAWSSLQTYKEKPSYLEHVVPPLIRRNTDSQMIVNQSVNGVDGHKKILNVQEIELLTKTGSAPNLS